MSIVSGCGGERWIVSGAGVDVGVDTRAWGGSRKVETNPIEADC